jgi:predicted DNA-binding protein (MmcQ/YjbR family)
MISPADPLSWLRAHCGTLPQVEEVVAWGHPNFRTAGRIFATFETYRGRPCIAVKTELAEQEVLVTHFGFFKTPYVGKQGWVSVWVDETVPWERLRDLITKAHLTTSQRPRQTLKSKPRQPRLPP